MAYTFLHHSHSHTLSPPLLFLSLHHWPPSSRNLTISNHQGGPCSRLVECTLLELVRVGIDVSTILQENFSHSWTERRDRDRRNRDEREGGKRTGRNLRRWMRGEERRREGEEERGRRGAEEMEERGGDGGERRWWRRIEGEREGGRERRRDSTDKR